MSSCLLLFMFHLQAVNTCFLRFFCSRRHPFFQCCPLLGGLDRSAQHHCQFFFLFSCFLRRLCVSSFSSLWFSFLPSRPSRFFSLILLMVSSSLVEPCLSYIRLVFFQFRLFVFSFHYLFVICMKMRYPVFNYIKYLLMTNNIS